MDELTKDLIQLYIDGQLDEAEADRVKHLIKSDSEAKSYYKELIVAQKQVKRLEHKAAFAQFAERWPKRVRTEHERLLMRRRTIRIASSMAAVAMVVFVGIGMLRSGEVVQNESMALTIEESADMAMPKEAAPTMEAPMMESDAATFAGSMESAPASAEDSSMADEASDSDGGMREREYPLPENAFIIHLQEGDEQALYDELLEITKNQVEQPLMAPNRVMLLITDENKVKVFTFLEEHEIPYEGLETGMTLLLLIDE